MDKVKSYYARTPGDDRTPVHHKDYAAESAEEAYEMAAAELSDWLGDEIAHHDCLTLECDLQIMGGYEEDADGNVVAYDDYLCGGTVEYHLEEYCDRCDAYHRPGRDGYGDCEHFDERCRDNMRLWKSDCRCWSCDRERREEFECDCCEGTFAGTERHVQGIDVCETCESAVAA